MINPDNHPFTGRVVRVRVKKLGITLDGYVIGRVIRTIDVGQPDPIATVDPDAAIVDEPWEPTRPSADETQVALAEKVTAHLTRCGTRHVRARIAKEIAKAIDEGYTQVCAHLASEEGKLYCRVGKIGKAALWALVGMDD